MIKIKIRARRLRRNRALRRQDDIDRSGRDPGGVYTLGSKKGELKLAAM